MAEKERQGVSVQTKEHEREGEGGERRGDRGRRSGRVRIFVGRSRNFGGRSTGSFGSGVDESRLTVPVVGRGHGA